MFSAKTFWHIIHIFINSKAESLSEASQNDSYATEGLFQEPLPSASRNGRKINIRSILSNPSMQINDSLIHYRQCSESREIGGSVQLSSRS